MLSIMSMSRPTYFASSDDFRNWLRKNRPVCTELLVGFYKKSRGKGGIRYPQALDEALCYGWIDGIRKSLNAEAYTIRFTPRKANSQWSAVSIKRARELLASGRMRPAGRKAFEGAQTQKRKYSYEQRRDPQLSTDHQHQFRAQAGAWAFFAAQRRLPPHGNVLGRQRQAGTNQATAAGNLDFSVGKWP